MITDILSMIPSTLAASPLTPLAGYALMIWIGAEAFGRVRAARRIAGHAEAFADYLARAARTRGPGGIPAAPDEATRSSHLPGDIDPQIVRQRGIAFITDELMPLRHRLQRDEVLAPLCGLAITMLAWALALPDATEVLRHDPQQLMRTLGMGAGSSFLGVVIAAVTVVAGKRIDIAHDRIVPHLEDLPPCPPSGPSPMMAADRGSRADADLRGRRWG